MRSLYLINVTVHVLAAFLWLGGMMFVAAVGAPVLRKLEDPKLRSELFRELGVRFRTVGWVCIAVLVLSGVGNLYFRGVLRWSLLGDAAFWAASYGQALAWKVGAVVAMIVISALHDFVLGPRASRLQPGTPEALASRRRAALLARWNAMLGIVVVIAAVVLARS